MTVSITYKYNITENTTIFSNQPSLYQFPNIQYSSILYCHKADSGKVLTNGQKTQYFVYTDTENLEDWWEIDDPNSEEE